ncbi:TetR family transcriptional regulator [Tamaricihabitans halophyticus]|uniref:TetR family transcriptional regulator n=1 Tax=Tamaricihabitans halophyticus TaxID=1262583 RepID=A0A4R2QA26_9PSEU|nr:TetR/AcrR family transcriptional regulator [Tamaricihabitans halophyticus]TCP45439.1 TetR family transcriptional regulator [Tamaricihabitans halophyticus]
MPKQVDHTQRRQQIAEALWRIAARDGLEAVSLSRVAEEAQVSKGRVQHYFSSREEMLTFTATHLRERVDAKVRARLEWTAPDTPLAVVRALAEALLPLDAEGRTEALVSSAFFVRVLASRELAATYQSGQQRLLDLLADQLTLAQSAGELPTGLDPILEADILLTVIAGIGDALLLGRHTPDSARRVLAYHLTRLSTAACPT